MISGFISEIDTFAIGNSIVEIGGGRMKAEDAIDHAVGFACEKKIGEEISTKRDFRNFIQPRAKIRRIKLAKNCEMRIK